MFSDISLRGRACLLIGLLDLLIVFEILALSKIYWYKDSEVQRGFNPSSALFGRFLF